MQPIYLQSLFAFFRKHEKVQLTTIHAPEGEQFIYKDALIGTYDSNNNTYILSRNQIAAEITKEFNHTLIAKYQNGNEPVIINLTLTAQAHKFGNETVYQGKVVSEMPLAFFDGQRESIFKLPSPISSDDIVKSLKDMATKESSFPKAAHVTLNGQPFADVLQGKVKAHRTQTDELKSLFKQLFEVKYLTMSEFQSTYLITEKVQGKDTPFIRKLTDPLSPKRFSTVKEAYEAIQNKLDPRTRVYINEEPFVKTA